MQLPFPLSRLLPIIPLNYSFTPLFAVSHDVVETPCPFLGQIYPPPTTISSSPVWKDAIAHLRETLSSVPSLANNHSSVAVQVVSVHETEPLFEYYTKATDHHHGKDGTASVSGDTVFRVASVSKMFTVYGLLLKCGFACFENPIGKYVPELSDRKDPGDPMWNMDWSEVTVGALAAQMSGIGRDYALADLASLPLDVPRVIGLPEVDPSEIPQCGADPAQLPCSREESIKLMLRHAPNFPSEYTPSYSNMAFQLLGYVLENVTGQSYGKAMAESVFKPLGMKHTTTSLPDLADGIVKAGDPTFEWDLGDATPAGGIYSTTNDLATLARAVLNNTQLSPFQTRRWLKPHSFTSLLQLSFGAPWEILRLPGLSPFHNVDLYTKSGNLATWRDPTQYTTLFALVPDLEVAVVITSYSADLFQASAGVLGSIAEQFLLPAFYDIAKRQAIDTFAGTYANPDTNSTLRVSSDESTGLVLTDLVYNSTDFLALLRQTGNLAQTVRLYPTTLTTKKSKKVAFRATILSPDPNQCLTSFVADALRYAGIGLDLVVFEMDVESGKGRAVGVEVPAFRTMLHRVDYEDDDEDEGRQILRVQ